MSVDLANGVPVTPLSPWWERHPERLEYELQALAASGVRFERDEAAFAAGIARLRVWPTVGGVEVELAVTFPDLYPFFRFTVDSPTRLGLDHHEAPVGPGALCLLDRATEAWRTHDTVAGLLTTQLPYTLAAGRSADREAVADIEAHQAEPFSEWYPYAPAMLQIDGGWVLPPDASAGEFRARLTHLGLRDDGVPVVHGVVVEVRDQRGQVIAKADPRLDRAHAGDDWIGRWTRSPIPIATDDPAQLFADAAALDVRKMEPSWLPMPAARKDSTELRIQMRAVVFPEEHDWRDASGQGWAFVVRGQRRRVPAAPGGSKFVPAKRLPGGADAGWRDHYAFTRAGRAGPTDLARRVPELATVRDARVAVVGLGCLGAPSALEFARAQIGELRILDGDFVDPGTVVRWPAGLSVAGRSKAQIIHDIVARDYPYTTVVAEHRRLGGVREAPARAAGNAVGGADPDEVVESDQALLERFTDGASLVYDASAEFGVQYFLSEFARERGLSYIAVGASYGGWGGRVVRIRPGFTAGCWACVQAARMDGSLPDPPADPAGAIQTEGCADPTFTGAGFDLVSVAMTGVRLAVSTLCAGRAGAYPATDWDVAVIALRNAEGQLIAPAVQTFALPRHPSCPVCQSRP